MFEREKKSLQALHLIAQDKKRYSAEDIETMAGVYRDYAAILTKLFKNQPNVFGNLRKYNLDEIKNHKRNIAKVESQTEKEQHFDLYQESIEHTIESTISYIEDYV